MHQAVIQNYNSLIRSLIKLSPAIMIEEKTSTELDPTMHEAPGSTMPTMPILEMIQAVEIQIECAYSQSSPDDPALLTDEAQAEIVGRNLEKLYLIRLYLDQFHDGPTKSLIEAADQLVKAGLLKKRTSPSMPLADYHGDYTDQYFYFAQRFEYHVLRIRRQNATPNFDHYVNDDSSVSVFIEQGDIIKNEDSTVEIPWKR